MHVSSVQQTSIPTSHAVSGASRVGGPGSEHRMSSALDAAAQLFGMTSQQLKDAVGSGQSMMAIAADKGVSSDDLIKALTTAIEAARPSGAHGPADPIITKIATRIANHSGPIEGVGQWGHHKHAPAPTADSGSTSASSTVDTYL